MDTTQKLCRITYLVTRHARALADSHPVFTIRTSSEGVLIRVTDNESCFEAEGSALKFEDALDALFAEVNKEG